MFYYSDIKKHFPYWFQSELAAIETANKLNSLTELDFYLTNTDCYIRSLAILRLFTLNLKESSIILQDIIANIRETETNKKLASIVLKYICLKHNLNLYVYNPYFTKFKSEFAIEKFFKANISSAKIIPKIQFEKSLTAKLNHNQNMNFSFDDSTIVFDFNLNNWFKSLLVAKINSIKSSPRILGSKFKSTFSILLNLIFKVFKKLKLFFINQLKSFILKIKNSSNINYGVIPENTPQSYFSKLHSESLILKILFILFTPIRIILKHIKISLLLLFTSAILLTYTYTGLYISSIMFSDDLYFKQLNLFNKTPDHLISIWNQVKLIWWRH